MGKSRSLYASFEPDCSNRSTRTTRSSELKCFPLSKLFADAGQFLATYLGRPPHLSYRYCVQQSSIELSDEEVCSEGTELTLALPGLERGHHLSKRPHRASWRRAWSQYALIRELILEIAIGPGADDLELRVRYVKLVHPAYISRY
jgi:hypothetical protein